MTFTLAVRNLFHDKASLAVTLVGIIFSVVLVSIQLGLYFGSHKLILAMIEHTRADLWIVPIKTKSFDDPMLLPGRERHVAMSVPGVDDAFDLVVGFLEWRKQGGGAIPVVLVGSSLADDNLGPWNVVKGDVAELTLPNAVAVDETYLRELDVERGIGDSGQVAGQRARVVAITRGIRSFTTLPYVFTRIDQARSYVGATAEAASFVGIRVTPGVDAAEVAGALAAKLNNAEVGKIESFSHRAEVISSEVFRDRSIQRWLYGTGAGAALLTGAALGLIVGTVIVAQTLYASTKDHLVEFATLRALGASASYIHRVILVQAIFSAIVGFLVGIALSYLIIEVTRETSLVIVIAPLLAVQIFGLTLAMCVISALSAIFKVTRIDPAMVFSR